MQESVVWYGWHLSDCGCSIGGTGGFVGGITTRRIAHHSAYNAIVDYILAR